MKSVMLKLRRLCYQLRHGPPERMERRRGALAARHLTGNGVEVGALHNPLPLPATARVRYVDRFSVEDLKSHYPEMAKEDLVEVDILDDGERLSTLEDGSVDFVIANHVIEHCEDPMSAMENWLRVLKAVGHLFLAVPDKRISFDHGRPVTSMDHFVADRRDGPQRSRRGHYAEWAECVPPESIERRVEELEQTRYSIHFHVWPPPSFRQFLDLCGEQFKFPFTLQAWERNSLETLIVLRRM
jgi:SAM-dependent methyltransferase